MRVKSLEGRQLPFQKHRKGRKDGREGGRRDEGEMAGKETERGAREETKRQIGRKERKKKGKESHGIICLVSEGRRVPGHGKSLGNTGPGKEQSHLEEKLNVWHDFHRPDVGHSRFPLLHLFPKLEPWQGWTIVKSISPTVHSVYPAPFSSPLSSLCLFQNSVGNSVFSRLGFLKHIPYFLEDTPKDGVGGAVCRLLLIMR